MKNERAKEYLKKPELWLFLIFVVGSLVRLACLDKNPMGLHQDEAYSAYNSWAVMNYGIDSYGYTRPVYYTVWGSGMSVLYSYLTMPFFAVWGVSVWTIRLPQAILGCFSILAVYDLGKEMYDERKGLLFAALLAINPWHIQQSRFGLDANLAAPMFLFAVCFLCRYLNGKRKSIWGAAVFMGLTLYCYALTWILVPVVLVLCMVVYHKRIVFDRNLLGAVALLFLMALPLLLFLAVNWGWIPEIRTGLFSIPRLQEMRTGEMAFSLGSLKRRFLWMAAMLLAQHDDIWWITNETVGSYYYISTPFILLGMLCQGKDLLDCLRRKRELPLSFLLSLWFAAAFLVGCSIDSAKYYKVNFIHIAIILYGAVGILCCCRLLGRLFNARRWIAAAFVCIYGLSFGYYVYSQASYEVNYEEYSNPLVSHMNWNQYEEAIDYAEQLTDGDIYIIGLNYANLMLYKQISPYDYLEGVVYEGDEDAFRTVTAIGRYHFNTVPEILEGDEVFIYPHNMEENFEEQGYLTEEVTQCYKVAYRRR